MSVVVVTGTGPGVGETVTTAALASLAAAKRGHRVAVVKLAQTGAAPGDLTVVTRLSGVTDVHEFARYPDRLAPHHAAAASGLPELDLAEAVRRIVDLDAGHDTVLVDGVGGLLVPFTSDGRWTLADLAATLRAPVLVVTSTGPGTINHTALTVGRIAEDGLSLAGIVIGRWPAEPDLAARHAVGELAALGPGGTLAGALPDGIGAETARGFRGRCRAALSRRFGGTFASGPFVAAAR